MAIHCSPPWEVEDSVDWFVSPPQGFDGLDGRSGARGSAGRRGPVGRPGLDGPPGPPVSECNATCVSKHPWALLYL